MGDSTDSVDSFLREVANVSESMLSLAMPTPPLDAGELVGDRFRIEALAGRGGMGSVYRAQDLSTGEHVAVKVVARESASFRDRFSREAAVLAELSHPCIVRYVAHGLTAQGQPFFAMDWLEGEDLGSRLGRSRLELGESLTVLRRACEGLALAHARGIVHRDIKPSNVFLVGGKPGGRKVIDFGVARIDVGASLTRSGTSLCTAGYMAPEQALDASDVDARADVFALGCVFYECVTGRPAFGGPPAMVLIKVLRDQPPRPSELRPGLSDQADTLVARLLAKDRQARPKDAAEVLRALDDRGVAASARGS
jgi:eukaryotic-like serine/threonine-protein kinase